jgi:putative adenylate-forming enzyme
MMTHFDSHNTLGIKLAEAFKIADDAEQSRDFNKQLGHVAIGLSSGTSGSRGIFMVSPEERSGYVASVLAKAIPHWWKFWQEPERIALFLRANSSLYSDVQKRRMSFKFFDLFSSFEKLTKDLIEYKPTLLIAPASVLKTLAEREGIAKIASHLNKIFSVAEVLEDDKIRSKNLIKVINSINAQKVS